MSVSRKPPYRQRFRDPDNQFLMAGTFGALVKDSADTYILSNNHVLADEDRLPVGSPIFQPGLLDNGSAATDQIAQFSRAVHLQAGANNQVDCALAKLLSTSSVTNRIIQIGAPAGVANAQIDMTVHKLGAPPPLALARWRVSTLT